ncbi:MAG: hypothetical protein LBB26_00120 [Puniceicoccales bacterium]|jgi:hypothetical protein|nr:hypothetical protein [Puniceicoccales bacterium]
MRNATTTASAADIFNGDREPQVFPILRLTPSLKLGPSFLRKFPAFWGQASPLPATQKLFEKHHQ